MREEKGSVGIRVDGGKGIGFGHIVRCVALADYISTFTSVLFITKTKNYLDSIINGRYSTVEIKDDKTDEIISIGNLSAIIIDLLEGGEELSEMLLGKMKIIVLISDFPKYIPPVSIYLYPTFIPLNIEKPKGVKVLSGGKYILLRREILSFLDRNYSIGDNVKNILIILGGGYRKDEEKMVLDTLQNVDYRGRVVLYSGIFSFDRDYRYNFRLDVNEGFKLPYEDMSESDIVVCGSGVSLFETMALGKPSITIPGSDREEVEVDVLSKDGLCIDGRGDIQMTLRKVLGNPWMRRSLVRKLDGIVDGRGAERVTGIIREMLI